MLRLRAAIRAILKDRWLAFAAIFGKVQPMIFGETTVQRMTHPPALVPVFIHLAIVLMLGLYIPPYLVDWYRQAAAFIG